MISNKLDKKEFQKRSLAIEKLVQYLQLSREPLSANLCYLTSPHGRDKHPYKWSDNELLGILEKEISKIESGEDEE